MPSVAVPASGSVSLSNIQYAFPNGTNPSSLLSYLGVHPSVPATPPIDMLSFHGLNAVSPTHAPATLYDTGVVGTANATAVLTATTLAVSTTGAGTLTLTVTLPTYLTNPSYQGAVTYSASVALPTGVTLNATTGVVSVVPGTVNTGTTALAYSLTVTATNKWGNTSALAVTFNFAAGLPTALPAGSYPPAALTASTTTLSGQPRGNGVYNLSVSSTLGGVGSGFPRHMAFNKNFASGDCWSSEAYYGTNGLYNFTNSTIVGGTSAGVVVVAGEWLQINMPATLVLSSYKIAPFVNADRSPYNFVLAGSINGVTWTQIDAKSAISGWAGNTTKTFTVGTVPPAYSFFRIICTATKPLTDNGTFAIGEWELVA